MLLYLSFLQVELVKAIIAIVTCIWFIILGNTADVHALLCLSLCVNIVKVK